MKKSFYKKKILLILYIIGFLAFYNFPFKEFFNTSFFINNAQAYVVVVDNNLGSTARNYMTRGSNVVFTTAATGYIFGRNTDGTCVYWKTTNGGRSWAAPAVLYSGTDCLGLAVWYDRWTPGDTTGNYVHLAFADDSDDDLYYERFDTSDDSQLGEVNVTGANQGGTLAVSNSYSITKSTGGTLYIGTSDDADSFVIKCNTNCGSASNWSELGANPMDADDDELILRPLANDDLMLVNWDISGHFVRSKVFTTSTALWDANWSNIATATDNTTYKHAFDITLNNTNNNLYICLNNTVDFTSNDIVTGIYNGTSWSTSTARPLNNTRSEGCSMGFDQNKNVIYLAYWESDFDTFSGESVWTTSTVNMASWSSAKTFYFGINQGDFVSPAALSFNLTSSIGIQAVDIDANFNDLEAENVTEKLIQTSWRWQNDDKTPNTNTNMAGATTTITNVNLGQRLTLRMQVADYGSQTTTTMFSLQFTTDDPTLPATSWSDIGASTTISFAYGTSTSGSSITSAVGNTPVGCGFANGNWYENTNVSGNITLDRDTYTELGYMIHTGNAAVNTTYYFRLYNSKAGRTLNIYDWYPSLTTVTTDNNTRYAKDNLATLYVATTTLTYYFDNIDFSNSASSDDVYTSSTATANTSPIFQFVQKNINNNYAISFNWEGQTTLACSTQNIKLQVYNFNTSAWENKATSTTCSANTDFSATSTVSSNVANYYDTNYWSYWRIYQNANTSVTTLKTDYLTITFSGSYALHQTSYRWQDDDSPANSNTNMAAATTTISSVKIGQRLTTRLQVENTGASVTTTPFVLQYCSGEATVQECSSWINLTTSTPLSTASSPASINSGASITAVVGGTPTSSASFSNGAWYEQTATTSSYTLNADTHTEFAFVVDTHNATENTTYYLRLFNQGINSALDSYYFYPTLTIISTDNNTRYSKGLPASLPTTNSASTFYFDDLEHTRTSSSDNTYATSTATANTYPLFVFTKKHTADSDEIAFSWEGQTDLDCATANLKLEVYNNTSGAWEAKTTNSSCSADTDTTITGSITSSLSSYYDSSYFTYFRIYQDSTANTPAFKTDYLSFTFTTPTPASSPSSGTTPGGSGLPATIYNPPLPPPQGFSLIINNQAEYTNILNVTLTLTAGEDTTEIAISNDPNFINIGLEPYQTTKSWNLTLGEGTKTVYAKFYTQYGQASQVVSDSIIYSLSATPEQLTPPEQTTPPGQTINLNDYQYLRKTTAQANFLFNNYVQGMILLRVENHGEAYYITPDTNKVYYLKDGNVAYQIMRQASLGINEKDYAVLRAKTNQGEALRRRLAGKIVLRVYAHGEAYYINPYTLVVTYLKDGPAAYDLMREQSLGITDENLRKLINIE